MAGSNKRPRSRTRPPHADPQSLRVTPNVDDPLSEKTIARRIWAMYLSRGYTRAQWARALEVSYQTAQRWDSGEHLPDLVNLLRMVSLLRYSLSQIVYGYATPPAEDEIELSHEGKLSTLRELRATADQLEAFGEYEASPAGRYQRYTRTWLVTFIDAYSAARRANKSRPEAIDAAKTVAANAAAQVQALTVQPQSAEQLAELGARVRTSKRKRTR